MGILDTPPARIAGGEVRFRGVDLLSMDEKLRRHVRANKIAMIFQDALSSLNPVFTVGWQLAESFRSTRAPTASRPRPRPSRCSSWSGSRRRRTA